MTTISTKDAITVVKKNSKCIIIMALVCGVLFGGYKCAKELKAVNQSDSANNVAVDYSNKMETYNQEKQDAENITALMEGHIATAYRFASENPIMKLDPSECNYSMVVIKHLDPNDSELDNTRRLVANTDGETLFGIKDDLLKKYKNDICSVYGTNGATAVYIYGVEGVDPHALAERLKDTLYKDSSLSKGIKDIQIADYEESYCQVLFNRQREIRNNAVDLQSNMRGIKEQSRMIEAPSVGTATLGKASIIKTSVKFFVVGLLFGAIVGILLVMFKITQGGSLFSREQIEDMFDLEYLGSLSEEDWDVIATRANIEALSGTNNRVMIIDNNNLNSVNILAVDLNQNEHNNNYCTGIDIIEDSETVRRCVDINSVIFAIDKGNTRFESIRKQIKRANALKKQIIGYVIV